MSAKYFSDEFVDEITKTAIKSTSSKKNGRGLVFWARLKGFPDWPARMCSLAEGDALRKKMQAQPPAKDSVAVSFLGIKCEKAYVDAKAIVVFSSESMDLGKPFSSKKFRADKDYRAAVVEAVRVASATEEDFKISAECNEKIAAFKKDFPLDPFANDPRAEVCVHCRGTALSGPFYECDSCSAVAVHWHCFRDMGLEPLNGRWICDNCCEACHIEKGTILPYEPDTPYEEEKPLSSSSSKRSRSSRSGNGNTHTSTSHPTPTTTATTSLHADILQHDLCRHSHINNDHVQSKEATGGNSNSISNGGGGSGSGGGGGGTHNSRSGGVKRSRNETLLESVLAQTAAEEHVLAADEADDVVRSDRCFVCGQDGQLVLCDFPGCVQVYHQMCVIKTFPSSSSAMDGALALPGMEAAGGVTLPEGGGTWFCPRHNCIGCGGLQKTAGSIHSLDLPMQYYLQHRSPNDDYNDDGGDDDGSSPLSQRQPKPIGTTMRRSCVGEVGQLQRKNLRMCNVCPFSTCADCEMTLLGSRQSFLTYKRVSMTLECLNCVSSDSSLALARLLEAAWAKMVSSRLAVPFLRPLLPLLDSNSDTLPAAATSSTGIDGTEKPESSELDLLSLIDKIRALKYRTLKEFQLDLNSMRNRIDSKLARYHTYIESTTSSGSVVISSEGRSANLTDYPTRGSVLSSERQVVLQAFDTIVDASYNFFSGQEFVVSTLEESIRSAAENTVDDDMDSDNPVAEAAHTASGSDGEGRFKEIPLARSSSTHKTDKESVESFHATSGPLRPDVFNNGFKVPEKSGSSRNSSSRKRKGNSAASKHHMMLGMWRRECNVQCFTGKPMEASTFSISARPLHVWAEFLTAGVLNTKFQKSRSAGNGGGSSEDPWGVEQLIRDHVSADWQEKEIDRQAKGVAEHLLYYENDFGNYLNDDLLAANLMIGMQHSNSHESITLLEVAPVSSARKKSTRTTNDTSHEPHDGDFTSMPLEDETTIILDRLQDITYRASQLHHRLRDEHMQRQRLLQINDSETLTVGQMGILRELKLANDNLRWRLRQREVVISSHGATIANLQKRLREAQLREEAAVEQLDAMKSQSQRSRQRTSN